MQADKSSRKVRLALALLLCLAGCTPQAASLLPRSIPSAPPPGQPQILSFDADPQSIAQGQASSLRWNVKGADNLRVEPEFGLIATEERRSITPRNTTTYELIATNGAGSVRAAVTVTVSAPPTALSDAALSPSRLPIVNSRLKDVHFKARDGAIASEDLSTLHQDASILTESLARDPQLTVVLEAHSDSRGSDGYDLALGDQDAATIKNALVSLGLPEARLFIVSVGREQLLCEDSTNGCSARSRRVHFSMARNEPLIQSADLR